MAQQNLPQATLALREYSLIETFWSTTPSAKLSSLADVTEGSQRRGRPALTDARRRTLVPWRRQRRLCCAFPAGLEGTATAGQSGRHPRA